MTKSRKAQQAERRQAAAEQEHAEALDALVQGIELHPPLKGLLRPSVQRNLSHSTRWIALDDLTVEQAQQLTRWLRELTPVHRA